MSFVYHVMREGTNSRKLVRVANKNDLMAELAMKFGCEQFTVQYAVTEEGLGEVFVYMDSVDDLPDKGKLLMVPKQDMSAISEPQQQPVTPQADSPSATPPVSVTNSQNLQTTTPSSAGQHSQNHLTYYCLPKFPKDVQQQLDAKKSALLCDRSMRSKIVRVLYADLLDKVGWFPSHDDYHIVCLALIKAYPFLEDKEQFGRRNCGRMSTWIESLKQKFKDSRRPLTDEESIKATKEKFGRKGLFKRNLDDPDNHLTETPRSKRSKFVDEADNGEDETSIAAHVATMKIQWKKSNPDMSVVSSRMEKTYADRRALVFNGSSTQSILDKYPTLRYSDQIIEEAKRMTGQDFRESLVRFFTNEIVEKILRDNSATKIFLEEAKLSNVNNVRRSAAVATLPSFFGEKIDRWIQWKTPERSVPDNIVFPCVVVDAEESLEVLNPANRIVVLVDNQELVDCPDIFTAFIVMLAAYYVFDITYPNALENTMGFIDSKVLGISMQKMSATIQRRINVLFL